MTPQEKKELKFITEQAIKVAIGIAVLFFALLVLSTLI